MATAVNDSKASSPVHKARVGAAVATVWKNHSENGRAYYSTTVARIYKNDEDKFVESHSYLDNQLLELSKVADLAHTWIVQQQAEDRAEQKG